MFANRYTAFVDACVLASALKRNILLTLAEAQFFRVRWSAEVMAETERAIERILRAKGAPDPAERAERACRAMEDAFEEATVTGFAAFLPACSGLPDPGDAHVLAAALKTRADTIVTDNLRHFPDGVLADFAVECRSADAFIADTIALDPGRAVPALQTMRRSFRKPEKTAGVLPLDMEANGLVETADVLRPHVLSL